MKQDEQTLIAIRTLDQNLEHERASRLRDSETVRIAIESHAISIGHIERKLQALETRVQRLIEDMKS